MASWSFGDDDFVAIFDAPDDLSAGAGAIAVGASGALRNVRTIKLITADESRKLLEKAKVATAGYVPPQPDRWEPRAKGERK